MNPTLRISRQPHRSQATVWRSFYFVVGDALFLMGVGVVSTLVMHAMHQLGWSFAFTCFLGMVTAMLIQMLMALCVSPVLGSIESMTPSMIVGMIAPMSICFVHLLGGTSECMFAAWSGAIFGMLIFLMIQLHGFAVRRWLRQYRLDE